MCSVVEERGRGTERRHFHPAINSNTVVLPLGLSRPPFLYKVATVAGLADPASPSWFQKSPLPTIFTFFPITLLDEMASVLTVCQLRRPSKEDLDKSWIKNPFMDLPAIHIGYLLLPQPWRDRVVQWEDTGFGVLDPCIATLQAVCSWANYLTSLRLSFLRIMIPILKGFFYGSQTL